MRLLLDTSAYSAFKRGHQAILAFVRQAELITLTPIILAELFTGFGRGNREARNRQELAQFLESPRVTILPLTEETAERYTLIHRDLYAKGTPIPTHDLWIAASAMEHGLRLLTTDAHFQAVTTVLAEYVDVTS